MNLSSKYCKDGIYTKQLMAFFRPCCLFFMFFLLGCTSSSGVQIKTSQSSINSVHPAGDGWWYVRFQIAWPDQEPQWFLGTMLAAEVVAPVLKENRKNIHLWRFHRRAIHDSHGHLFSFIFYSSAKTAEKVNQSIEESVFLAKLKSEKKITAVSFDDVWKIKRPDIEASSDGSWPKIIQKTWPTFIMGASQMWLDLVIGIAAEEPYELDYDELYDKVQNKITSIWVKQGRHAWMHHLNALYAYQPVFMHF